MERRSAVRYPLLLDTLVSSVDSRKPLEESAEIRNISSRGALFASREPWKKDQPVSMMISLGKKLNPPYSYDLKLDGRIVRESHQPEEKGCFYAVEFEGRWKFMNRGEEREKEVSSKSSV